MLLVSTRILTHHYSLLTYDLVIVNKNVQNKANNGWKKGFLGPSPTSSSASHSTATSSTSSSIRAGGHPLPPLPPIAEEPSDTAAMDTTTSTINTISASEVLTQSLSHKLDQLNLSDPPPPTITPPPPPATPTPTLSVRDKIIKDKIIERINESGLSTAPPPMRTFAPNASQAKRARMIVADKVTERFP